MITVGCDFHTRFQQVALLDPTTGEVIERRLEHENGDAEKFYGTLPGPACVGMEATIHSPWFERMLHRYGHELWVGDAAEIRACRVRPLDRRNVLQSLEGASAGSNLAVSRGRTRSIVQLTLKERTICQVRYRI